MSNKKKLKKASIQKIDKGMKKSVTVPKSVSVAPSKKEVKKPVANAKKTDVPCILDSFKSIGKMDKRRFVKMAGKMGISEEELLGLTVSALVKGKIKFEAKKVYITA